MESSPSQEMGSKSVAMVSSLLLVAATGVSSNRITTTTELSSTRVSGLVTGCPQISVEVVLAILVVHTSVCPTFAFQVPWCKALNPKSVQDRSLLLHLLQRQVPPLLACARPQLARTMMEPICSPVRSPRAAPKIAATAALPQMVVSGTPGFMQVKSAG